MSILFVLIPLTLLLVVLAGWAFFWAVSAGQFDDLESPGWEVLRDERVRRDVGDDGDKGDAGAGRRS